MDISQSGYGIIFLYALMVGALLGAVYDVFRVQRVSMAPSADFSHMPRLKKRPAKTVSAVLADEGPKRPGSRLELLRDAIIFVEDIIFSAIAAVIVIILIFHANSGRIRWFALAGALAGFSVYYVTVGRIVMACSECIVYIIRLLVKTVCTFLYRITVLPLARFTRSLCGVLWSFCRKRILRRYAKNYMRKIENKALAGFPGPVNRLNFIPQRKSNDITAYTRGEHV